ncbi:uncharacterized [Tachysurus ichikawai]
MLMWKTLRNSTHFHPSALLCFQPRRQSRMLEIPSKYTTAECSLEVLRRVQELKQTKNRKLLLRTREEKEEQEEKEEVEDEEEEEEYDGDDDDDDDDNEDDDDDDDADREEEQNRKKDTKKMKMMIMIWEIINKIDKRQEDEY